MKDVKAAAKVHKTQAPISRSVKSELGVSKVGQEHIPFNKVFLICYVNTQSGPYWVRVANSFQMFKKKKKSLTTISLYQNDSCNYRNKGKMFWDKNKSGKT